MANKVKAIILTGNGTNCEMEMAHACKLAGADRYDIVHISELLFGEKRLSDYNFLNLPGGFLDGDDLGSAKAGANRFLHAPISGANEMLIEELLKFINAGGLILGVCNGFQLMVKLGLLPALSGNFTRQSATLTFNDSGRFEDRWVYLRANAQSPCVFTKELDTVYYPVRHGEGKFVPESNAILEQIERKNLTVFQYGNADGSVTMDYPANPNGSVRAIAGICNESGRLFGLMPHPEAFLHRTNHPRWTREDLPEEGQGLAIFKNAVAFIRGKEF
ncbi:MAG TPA: phosphoribosylformylglycinamidine synthase subunit PurQ [Smithellaceae bacterium]|jgi:phosphoribosylformylglycinamidine synthase|nr:phosphoribosylformylglycinamidine synthase subunit PurQ [Smithella sp.]HNY96003.1 phosphoribosylformylglycinamidine synthase subunit PurQ [Smithellaceae bacterium]HOH56392.1 phosphoribosylformylglycinamidine synthase subunit PurQ [Smithellaceae bacterium]HOU56143.1 phosphoribosylformylglycinamidine synthase subunit PurQ [Smithellaceae bacterium]HQH00219.1 phosphoribosylformylglycinamidine synthase subunit PurQ [Smithellaceae bacterium]